MNTVDYQVYRDGIEDNYLDDLDSYLDAKERQVKNDDWLFLARIVNSLVTPAFSGNQDAMNALLLVWSLSDYDYIGDGFNDLYLLRDWINAIDVLSSTKGIVL